MREAIFQGEWRDSWRKVFEDSHYIKIPDVGGTDARFIPKKPYDCYAVLDGQFIAMELKLMVKLQGFPFNKVTQWQLDNLLEVKYSGATAYVVINYRVKGISDQTMKNNGLKEDKLNEVYMIGIGTFERLDRATDAKSLPFQRLRAASTIIKQGEVSREGILWDLRKEYFI